MQAESSFETSLQDPAGESQEPAGVAHRRSWDGLLARIPGTTYPDGSVTSVFRFLELGQTSTVGPNEHGTLQPSALAGIPLGVRHFDDNEILGFVGLEGWSGSGRHGDLLLPLWPAVSPDVPALDGSEDLPHRVNLPLLLDRGRGIVVALDLAWDRIADTPPAGLPPCRHLRYRGSAKGAGVDQEASWRARIQVEGPVAGDLWLSRQDGTLLLGEYAWDLTLKLALADATSGTPTGRLSQRQRHAGTLRRVSMRDLPAQGGAPGPEPLPAGQVLDTLHAAGQRFSACLAQLREPAGTGATRLGLEVGTAGQVRSVGLDAAPWADDGDCLREVTCDLAFPPAPEPSSRWSYTLAWRDGAVQPYPSVDPVGRRRGPLLLDPSLPGDARGRLGDLLGGEEPEGPPSGWSQPCDDARSTGSGPPGPPPAGIAHRHGGSC